MAKQEEVKKVKRVLTGGKHWGRDADGNLKCFEAGDEVELTPTQCKAFADKFAEPQKAAPAPAQPAKPAAPAAKASG